MIPKRRSIQFRATADTTHAYGASTAAYTSADVTPPPRPQPSQAYDSSEPRQASPRKNEKLRQDFIAEARRAKMRLAAAAEDEIVITSPADSGAFSMSSVGGGSWGSRKPADPSAGKRAESIGSDRTFATPRRARSCRPFSVERALVHAWHRLAQTDRSIRSDGLVSQAGRCE